MAIPLNKPEPVFQDIPLSEREEELLATCDEVLDDQEYERPLTEEEDQNHQARLVELDMEIFEKDKAFKVVSDSHKAEKKPLVNEKQLIQKDLSSGTKIETGKLFGNKDLENNVMNYHDSQGRFVFSRILRVKERQLTIQGGINDSIRLIKEQ